MTIQRRLLTVIGVVLLLGYLATEFFFYQEAQRNVQNDLKLEAERVRGMMMATRRVYHLQFLDSGLPLTEKTLGFLPAHAMTRISRDYANWESSGLVFNNVSDRPRNPSQQADPAELLAMRYFREHPEEQVYFQRQLDSKGNPFFQYARPIWIEPYCLKCHGNRDQAPATISRIYAQAYDYQVGDLRGVMSIKLPGQEMEERLWRHMQGRIFSDALIFAALFAAIFWVLRVSIARPLHRAMVSIQSFSAGDEDYRMPELPGELSILSEGFNELAQEMRRGQKELVGRNWENSRLIEMAQVGVCRLDADLRILYLNPQFCTILGYPPEGLLRHRLTEFVSANHCGELEAILGKGIQSISQSDFEFRHQGGSILYLSLAAGPLPEAAQGQSGLLVYCFDITARKINESALKSAMLAAEAASMAKDNFLATMSHELRTPMNGVMGMAQVLLLGPLEPEQRHQVQIILNSGEALIKVLSNVLSITRIEAGKESRLDEPFDLVELCQSTIRLFFGSAVTKGLHLILHWDSLLASQYVGDGPHLEEILHNLVANAIKFTETGEVQLRVSLLETHGSHQTLRFEVIDTGVGIAPEVQQQIFNPFEQGDNSSTRRYGGSGLGLAIVKELVLLMGSRVFLESRLGQGSRFWFDLDFRTALEPEQDQARPAPPEATAPPGAEPGSTPPAPEPDLPQEAPPPGAARILVIEDEEINRMVIKKLLEVAGYRALAVGGGQEGLDLLKREPVDLVLMDCVMPLLDGFETTRMLRRLQALGEIPQPLPVVALTAKAMAGDKALCLEAGMDDYLAKPLHRDELERVLKHWLNGPTGTRFPDV